MISLRSFDYLVNRPQDQADSAKWGLIQKIATIF